ncbi:MAG: LytTR family DNA-binding domain-containing protein [Bacteroidales bacterium]|nr:LytTR family DNA-binding domain-containing protein [Bacteroidales bacterium]
MESFIKCIAIDDEPLALEVITKFCQRKGGIQLTTFTDPSQGLTAIRREEPQIVFLDIEMDDINGLDIASQLPSDTCLIFTTAYLDYAIHGYELDAVDYLHKPFAYSRFVKALDKAMRRISPRPAPLASEKAQEKMLVVKQEYNNVSIPLAQIAYIEAMEGYVKIYRDDGKCTLTRIILKNIEATLPADQFLRIHRSFIIPKSKVKHFNKQEVKLTSGKSLPVGRKYANSVAKALRGISDENEGFL